jgi:CPA1 family monovalent cation:H+ antiporter
VRRAYDFRQRRFASRIDDRDDRGIEERSQRYQKLMLDLYESQREALTALRNEGRISDEVMRRIQRELDLEEARLDFVNDGEHSIG